MAQSATALTPSTSANRIRSVLKLGLWVALVLIGARFVLRDAIPYFSPSAENYGPYWSNAGWIFLHVTGGLVAITLGPLQFFTGLKRWNLKLHRWTGRLYLAAIGGGGAGALFLSFNSAVSPGFGFNLSWVTMAWWTTGLMAYFSIRRRKVQIHKEWMIRSYILTIAFAMLWLFQDLPVFLSLGAERPVAMLWMTTFVPLAFAEVFLQWRRTFGSGPTD